MKPNKKKSLHAIKDEMYTRQSLQKQFSQLSVASVAYTVNEKFVLDSLKYIISNLI